MMNVDEMIRSIRVEGKLYIWSCRMYDRFMNRLDFLECFRSSVRDGRSGRGRGVRKRMEGEKWLGERRGWVGVGV
uniref:hypothetical protein n=1 Tax=Staphylococcus epidermidis TaxID=1282 RepID=UPI001C92D8D4